MFLDPLHPIAAKARENRYRKSEVPRWVEMTHEEVVVKASVPKVTILEKNDAALR